MYFPSYEDAKGIKNVWLVGGSVRDHLLHIPYKDLDYAVEAISYEHMRDWINSIGTLLVEKPEFYTIRARIVLAENAQICDFVMCRKEGPYSDMRRPDFTTPGTLHDDLLRRDFTVNAMAMDSDGSLIDPWHGKQDLELKILRTVRINSEDCFQEDPLRLLRAVRFSLVKGFTCSPEITRCFQNTNLVARLRHHVHVDRKREELTMCFQHDTAATIDFLSQYPMLVKACFDGKLWLQPTCKRIK